MVWYQYTYLEYKARRQGDAESFLLKVDTEQVTQYFMMQPEKDKNSYFIIYYICNCKRF